IPKKKLTTKQTNENSNKIIIPTIEKVNETIDPNNIINGHTITNKILIGNNITHHHHHHQQQRQHKEKIKKQQQQVIENSVDKSQQQQQQLLTASVENNSGNKTITTVAKKRKKEISTTSISTSCSSSASIAAGQQSDNDIIVDPEAKNIINNGASTISSSLLSGINNLKSDFNNTRQDITDMKDNNNTKMDIMENVDLISNVAYDCQSHDSGSGNLNMTSSMDSDSMNSLTKDMANLGNEQISSNDGDDERSVTPSPANVQGLPYKELCEQLRYQLEYYFSYKNLSKDQYLVSQMDDEQYVAISIVANFDKIRRLTNDLDLVVQVLRSSAEVTVDDTGTKVKPNSKRRVVILRDVPVEITRDIILKIFDESKCPVKLEKCESTHNQSYYLHFQGDEDAQKAMTYLRDELIYYPSTQIPILARIKAKPTVRHHTNPTNTNSVLGPNGKPNTVVFGAPMPVPPHNVISPLGIVTAPSPVGSTVSSHSAAVSPVSSISGSIINTGNQPPPNHSTTTVLLPTSATIAGGTPGTAESTLNAIPYSNAANIYSYNVPPLTR
ncbi:la-related-like protein, partial [Euroglyphus maynei]